MKFLTNPTVSVLVPNYNHALYLKRRIDSVLAQSYTDFELILLDDCSTDGSQEILRSYADNPHVTQILLNEQNSGSPFTQWEKGIKTARGKYIWIAESDDMADKYFLEFTVKGLEAYPEARVCCTGSYIIDSKGNPMAMNFDPWEQDGDLYFYDSHSYLREHLLSKNSVYNASMVLFRKDGCLDGIDTRYRSMRYCGDWLFWIEQIRKGGIVEVHAKLNYFRKHTANTTAKGAENANSLAEIAYIRNKLYSLFGDTEAVAHDKCRFYRIVKQYPKITSERRRELLRMIAQEAHVTWRDYWKWKLLKWRYRQEKN